MCVLILKVFIVLMKKQSVGSQSLFTSEFWEEQTTGKEGEITTPKKNHSNIGFTGYYITERIFFFFLSLKCFSFGEKKRFHGNLWMHFTN